MKPNALCTASILALIAMATPAFGQESAPSPEDRAMLRSILEEAVRTPTVKGRGKGPELAGKFAVRLREAGFPEKDIQILAATRGSEPMAAFVARYAGKDPKAKPILLIGHMDVVDVTGDVWDNDPFELTEKDGLLFGRGVADNKGGISALLATFIRLKRAGYVPRRDIVIALSGDEETGMETTELLAKHPFVAGAEFALNTDAGGGGKNALGKAELSIQIAEKQYADYTITASGIGGHSSSPTRNSAIYNLAEALAKIKSVKFPIMFNAASLPNVKEIAEREQGEVGDALRALIADPANQNARNVVEARSSRLPLISTTCVATVLRAGESPNAIPEAATANVNCRVLPGMPIERVTAELERAVTTPDVKIKLKSASIESPISPTNPKIFKAVLSAAQKVYPGATLSYVMGSGGTDGRIFRTAGIPTYGVGAIVRARGGSAAHGSNERIPVESFYNQIVYWDALVRDLGSK